MLSCLRTRFQELPLGRIYGACGHSRSQLYQWEKGLMDRKARVPNVLDEKLIEDTARVVGDFPHFGGAKGQAYLLYHGIGFIGQKAYDGIKKKVRRVLIQEVSQKDVPGKCRYEHVRPEGIGEIWAEDFTQLAVNGIRFKVALLIDVFDQYILGCSVDRRATEALVAVPVQQALAANGGRPPAKFLLEDNGTQYVSERHQRLLKAHDIVSRNIPACTPQYNGSVECGGKEFKNLFYNVWERLERNHADKKKSIDERVHQAVAETVDLSNFQVPRPALGGVTPSDVHFGLHQQRQKELATYREQQLRKKISKPLSGSIWDVIKRGVQAELMGTKELLTKLAFFGMRPLRRIAKINQEVWGN